MTQPARGPAVSADQDSQSQSSSTANPANASFAAQWLRTHQPIGNATFTAIKALPAVHQQAVMLELQQTYGNAFVQRGQAGKLPDTTAGAATVAPAGPESASALQADKDFAAAHGNAQAIAADLGTSRANHDYDVEMMSKMKMGSAMLDGVVDAGPEVAQRAILEAETAGVIDANAVIAKGANGGNWANISRNTEDQAQAAITPIQNAYDSAKTAYDACNQQLIVELYQLGPTLTQQQRTDYQKAYIKQNQQTYNAYPAAASALAKVMTTYGNPISAAAATPSDQSMSRNARASQLKAYQSLVDNGSAEGARATLAWAVGLGRVAETTANGKAELAEFVELNPGVFQDLISRALAAAAAPSIGQQMQKLGPKGVAGPNIATQFDSIYSQYVTPLSDCAQIAGLLNLRGVNAEIMHALDEYALKLDGKTHELHALHEAAANAKLAKIIAGTPVMSKLLRLFLDGVGVAGMADGAFTSQLGTSLIAFANNDGATAIQDSLERLRNVGGMVTEVRDPSLALKMMPYIGLAANAVQFAFDAHHKEVAPTKVIRLFGDLVAIAGSVVEMCPGAGPVLGGAIQAIGFAISAAADLGDYVMSMIQGPTPTAVQNDERSIGTQVGLSPKSIVAQTQDPSRSGEVVNALSQVFDRTELIQLTLDCPTLFSGGSIAAANVHALTAARLTKDDIRMLCMKAPDVLTNSISSADLGGNALMLKSSLSSDQLAWIAQHVPELFTRPHAAKTTICLWDQLLPAMKHQLPLFPTIVILVSWSKSGFVDGIDWAIQRGDLQPGQAIEWLVGMRDNSGFWWNSQLFKTPS